MQNMLIKPRDRMETNVNFLCQKVQWMGAFKGTTLCYADNCGNMLYKLILARKD